MDNKKTFLAIAGVASVLFVGFLLDRFVWVSHPKSEMAEGGRDVEQLKLSDYDLAQGHLVWNSGDMEGSTWLLRFSQPAVASFGVVFSNDAECFVDGAIADCTRLMPPSGSSTSMTARQEGETVVVSRLEIKTR